MTKNELHETGLILLILSFIYIILKHFINYGEYIVYPISILVTFLHEFGHSFFAFLTGGGVKSVTINLDGSGLATTYGGFRPLILMGGYIGSAIFGNILLYVGATKKYISRWFILAFSFIMLIIAIYSFSFNFAQIISTIILIFLAFSLSFLAIKIKDDNFNRIFLMFMGIASILYIIEDFNIGPSSDIKKFSQIFIFIPDFFWMFIWLFIVIIITGYNLKLIFLKKTN